MSTTYIRYERYHLKEENTEKWKWLKSCFTRGSAVFGKRSEFLIGLRVSQIEDRVHYRLLHMSSSLLFYEVKFVVHPYNIDAE